jgi:putative ABC transport system permease protein
MTPLREELVGDLRPALQVLAAASALAFLVALLNCATLTGLRALRERPTVAVRAALGAGLANVSAEALVRHLSVSLFAAGLALVALGPLSGPVLGLAGSASINEFDVSPRADLSTIALTMLVALFAAAVLTLVEVATLKRALRQPAMLRETRMTHSRTTGRILKTVTVGQMVASIVVVSAALLVTRGYLDQVYGERGFDPRGLWLVDVSLPNDRFADTPRRLDYVDRVLERLRSTPGVSSAGASTVTPDEAGSWGAAFRLPGQEAPAIGYTLTNHRLVSAGYFGALGIPMWSGRDFEAADFGADARSVIVSREFAELSWPGRDPLGQQIQRHHSDQLLTVVGVVGDVREAEQAEDWDTTIAWYLPASLGSDYDFSQITFAIRLDGDAATRLPPALAAIRQVDPNLALNDIASMPSRLAATYAREVYTSRLFGAFAMVSLLIAAIGVYALLAFVVANKQAEYGLRLALGESPHGLVRRLWLEAFLVSLVGVAIGLPASWASGRLLANQMGGLPAWSSTYAGVAIAVCLLLQLFAVVGPSLRTLKVSPLTLLRGE